MARRPRVALSKDRESPQEALAAYRARWKLANEKIIDDVIKANNTLQLRDSEKAHLVDLLSTSPSLVAAQGAKPWLATVSLDTATLDMVETMRRPHYRLYDNAFGADPSYWNQSSPMQQLTRAPMPMLLICSTTRPDHPCPQAERFAAKVKSLGGRATVLPQSLSHMQVNANLGLPNTYTDAVDAFLQSVGLP